MGEQLGDLAYDLYEALGLCGNNQYTRAEIVAAYRKRALECHPDKCRRPDAHEQFLMVSKAVSVLANEKSKEAYDYIRKCNIEKQKRLLAQAEAAAKLVRQRQEQAQAAAAAANCAKAVETSETGSCSSASDEEIPTTGKTGTPGSETHRNRSWTFSHSGRSPRKRQQHQPRKETTFEAATDMEEQIRSFFAKVDSPKSKRQNPKSSSAPRHQPRAPPPGPPSQPTFYRSTSCISSASSEPEEPETAHSSPTAAKSVLHWLFEDVVKNCANFRRGFKFNTSLDNGMEDEKDRQFIQNSGQGEPFELKGRGKAIAWAADDIFLLMSGEDNDADLIGDNGTLSVRGIGHSINILGHGWTVLLKGKEHHLTLSGRDGRIRIHGKRHRIRLHGDGGTVEISGVNYDIEIMADNVKCFTTENGNGSNGSARVHPGSVLGKGSQSSSTTV